MNLGSFPSQDMFHAGCHTSVQIGSDCATAFTALDKTIKSYSAGGPSHGLYEIHSEVQNMSIWTTRTTPTKHYVDDIEFTLTPSGNTCSIAAQSRSQTLSYLDYDTNYCNMWNVVKGSGLDFSDFKTNGACSGIPTDAERLATCNKY